MVLAKMPVNSFNIVCFSVGVCGEIVQAHVLEIFSTFKTVYTHIANYIVITFLFVELDLLPLLTTFFVSIFVNIEVS